MAPVLHGLLLVASVIAPPPLVPQYLDSRGGRPHPRSGAPRVALNAHRVVTAPKLLLSGRATGVRGALKVRQRFPGLLA